MYHHLHDIEQVRICIGKLARSLQLSEIGGQAYR
jgi:hypothetical protein